MKPCSIDPRSIQSQLHRKDFGTDWPAGAFSYQLTLYESDKNVTDALCEWLSINCKDNFIVVRDTCAILAGGYADNADAWVRNAPLHDPISEIRVRLSSDDLVLFTLAWLS